MQETRVWYLGQEDPLEKGPATHSSILAWRIPWTEEPRRLQSMGSQRVGLAQSCLPLGPLVSEGFCCNPTLAQLDWWLISGWIWRSTSYISPETEWFDFHAADQKRCLFGWNYPQIRGATKFWQLFQARWWIPFVSIQIENWDLHSSIYGVRIRSKTLDFTIILGIIFRLLS